MPVASRVSPPVESRHGSSRLRIGMSIALAPASRLPPHLRLGLAAYAQRIAAAAGAKLVSLAVFGAVLTQDWRAGRTVHQTLVLSDDDLELISWLGKFGSGAVELGLAAPVLLTPALLRSSLDTFPLEWLEIAGCHEVLAGSDPFTGLVFAHEHVRLQCERECAVLAISLRQRVIAGPRSLAAPLTDLGEHAVRILRGWLHLGGAALPDAPSELIAAAGRELGLELAPVVSALDGGSGLELVTALHRILVELGRRSDGA